MVTWWWTTHVHRVGGGQFTPVISGRLAPTKIPLKSPGWTGPHKNDPRDGPPSIDRFWGNHPQVNCYHGLYAYQWWSPYSVRYSPYSYQKNNRYFLLMNDNNSRVCIYIYIHTLFSHPLEFHSVTKKLLNHGLSSWITVYIFHGPIRYLILIRYIYIHTIIHMYIYNIITKLSHYIDTIINTSYCYIFSISHFQCQ